MGLLALARRRAPRLAGAVLSAAAAAAASCRSVTDPPLPGGAVPLTPPAVFARWWAMTEACSGIRRNVGEIAWYVVPDAASFASPSGGGDANGYYSRPGSQIVLAGQHQLDGGVVRHEMLHALLRAESGHPRGPFLARCAGVVRCEQACVRDAGPAPAAPADLLRLESSALILRAELAPAGAGTPGEDAWYTLTVSATNPANYPVDVGLAPVAFAPNFGYVVTPDPPPAPAPGVVTGYAHGETTFDAGTSRFAAGETKRHVFDFHVLRDPRAGLAAGAGPGDVRLAPGAFLFLGRYGDGGATATPVSATLRP